MAPLVSVIMPVYNKEEFVESAVQSALDQTFRDFEVIVCIDGATDNSEKIVRDMKHDGRLRIISKLNEGLATTRNVALSFSEAEFFLPLDGDDLIDPRYLEKTVPYMLSSPSIGIVCTDMQYFGTRHTYIKSWTNHFGDTMTREQEYRTNNIPVCSLVRRAAYDQVPEGYNPALWAHEDWSMWISILSRGWKVHCIHEPLFKYRVRDGSLATIADRHRRELDSIMREIHGSIFTGSRENQGLPKCAKCGKFAYEHGANTPEFPKGTLGHFYVES